MQSPTEWFHSSATPRVAQQSGPPYVDSSDSSRRASEQSYDGIGSLMRSTHERPPTNAANDRPRKRVKKEEGTQDSLPAVKSPTDKEEVVSRHNSSPVPDDSHILDSGWRTFLCWFGLIQDMICNICLELPPSQIYRQFDRSIYEQLVISSDRYLFW